MKRAAVSLALSLATLFLPQYAQAALFRAYLSVNGSDANPCTLPQPCRLLPAALATVASGGEVWILDSANFNTGTVVVSSDVTIMAIPGAVGSVVALGGTSALLTSGTVKLRLRNIVIGNNALNPGTDGVVVNLGGDLAVEDCAFAVPNYGILSLGGKVSVARSSFRDGADGIYANGNSQLDVWSSRFSGFSFAGIEAVALGSGANLHVSVSDSSFTSSVVGVVVDAADATSVGRATVVRSSFSNSAYAVAAQVFAQGGQAIMSIAHNMFSNIGISAVAPVGGGVVETLSNNTARNNAANGTAVGVSSF